MKMEPNREPKMRCPNCGGRVLIVKSKGITPMYREITYQCQQEPCLLRFAASLSPVREIIASGAPRPGFHLPRVERCPTEQCRAAKASADPP